MKRLRLIATAVFYAFPFLALAPQTAAQSAAAGHGKATTEELLSFPILEQHLREMPSPINDSAIYSLLFFDLLEYRANSSGSNTLTWDFVGWIGGDYNRLWVKTEGDLQLERGYRGQGDLQLLYGRLIAPFWDVQTGVRFNQNLGGGWDGGPRSYFALGLQGLAPYNFEVEPTLYVSDRGEVSAELTLAFSLYLTQRLALQPRFETAVSAQGDRKFETGRGFNYTDLGLRLRYEIRREFAPYIGISWLKKYGDTARVPRDSGESAESVSFVAGVSLWF